MDSSEVSQAVDLMTPGTGFVLTPEVRAAMQSSLAELKKNSKLHTLLFWGQIQGVKADYLIAIGFPTQNLLQDRKVYCSKDGVSWVQLPDVDAETCANAEKVAELFSGDPSHEFKLYEPIPEDPEAVAAAAAAAEAEAAAAAEKKAAAAAAAAEGGEEEEEDEEEEEAEDEADAGKKAAAPKVKTIIVTEEKRLAAIVAKIETETGVVPRGAYTLNSEGQVVRNRLWSGLAAPDAKKIASYLHLSKQDLVKQRSLLDASKVNPALDFSDSLESDQPKGAWSLQYDGATAQVFLRSINWPGFSFHHVAGTPKHHRLYCGNGLRNRDTGFML